MSNLKVCEDKNCRYCAIAIKEQYKNNNASTYSTHASLDAYKTTYFTGGGEVGGHSSLSKEEQIIERIRNTTCLLCGKDKKENPADLGAFSVGGHYMCIPCHHTLTKEIQRESIRKVVKQLGGTFCEKCWANTKACTCDNKIALEKLSS